MSADIKKGDLVMTIRPLRCCGGGSLGLILSVTGMPHKIKGRCVYCHAIYDTVAVAVNGEHSNEVPTYRIKKIDPPAEGDSLPTRRDLMVPA